MSNAVYPSAVRGLTFTQIKGYQFNTLKQISPNFYSTRIAQTANPIWYWTLVYDYLKNYPAADYAPSLSYTDLQYLMGFCLSNYGEQTDFLYSDPDDNLVGPAVITATWLARYPYVLGTIIIDSGGHAQKVTAAPYTNLSPGFGLSGSSAPTWNHAGGNTTDGDLTWLDLGVAPAAGWPNPQAQLQLITVGGTSYSPLQRNMGGQFYEDITDLNGALTVYDNGVLKTTPANYSVIGPGVSVSGYSWMGKVIQWVGTPTGPVTVNFGFYFRVKFKSDKQDFEKFMQYLWTIGGSGAKGGSGSIEIESCRTGTV